MVAPIPNAPSSSVLDNRTSIQHHAPTKSSLRYIYYYNAHLAAYIDVHLMAPVFPRQSHQFPSPLRPPKEEPATPVPVTKHFSAKVFFELFAGTFCIFVLGVLFWKLGAFFRRFTRGRVLKKGRTTDMRYARTWYGWVPLQRHEATKDILRKSWAKICEWTAWKTTRADYSWIWWDPGQKAYDEHRRKKEQLRWLPEFLRSQSITPADVMWNHDSHFQCANTSKEHQPATVTEAPRDIRVILRANVRLESSENTSPWKARFRQTKHQHGYPTTPFINGLPLFNGATHISFPRRRTLSQQERMFLSLDQPIKRYRGEIPFLDGESHGPVSQRIGPLSHRSLVNIQNQRKREQKNNTKMSWGIYSSSRLRFRVLWLSRKYQVETAKMQLNTPNPSKYNQCGFRGPPGSPHIDTLGSHASEDIRLFRSFGRRQEGIGYLHLDRSRLPLESFSSPFNLRCGNTSSSEGSALSRTRAAKGKWPEKKGRRFASLKQELIPPQDLSEWEVRWINNVDRKLEWHVNQLSPGRRPFHFPLLANHWLNKRTWIIFDPASRVPSHNQRQWGDPRFNVPYPAPRWGAKPRYQAVGHKLAQKPRIDSWRRAINRQRRASGIRNLIKTVELFDDSIDDPPDGMVDPASWMLRKPPQGFLISTKRDSIYYEGGRGWQEKFRDWQKVRHGYRIRKMIYEGKANRTRVKELATSISRPCHSATSKVIEKIQR